MTQTTADYFMPKEYLDETVKQTTPAGGFKEYVSRKTYEMLDTKDVIYMHDPLMPSFVIELWVNKVY